MILIYYLLYHFNTLSVIDIFQEIMMMLKSPGLLQWCVVSMTILNVENFSHSFTKQVCSTFSEDDGAIEKCPTGSCCSQSECNKEGQGMKCKFSNCPPCCKSFLLYILLIFVNFCNISEFDYNF